MAPRRPAPTAARQGQQAARQAPQPGVVTVAKGGFKYAVGPVPAWVQPAQLPPAAASAMDGAPMHFRLIDDQVRIDADGSEADHARVVRVVDDAAGLAAGSQIELAFDPSYQALTLHRLDVVRQGQRVGRLQNSRIELLQRETQLEQRVHDGRVTVSIVVEDLRVGDEIDFAYTLQGRNPVFGDRFVHREWMTPMSGPAQLVRLRLLAPASRPIRHVANPPDMHVESRVDGGQREWLFTRTAVPQARFEPGTPASAWLAHEVQFSEYADWGEVAAWGERLFADAAPGPLVAAKAAELHAAHADAPGRALAALAFVQREIRYLGIEIGPGTHRPAPPDRVLQQRYGDCKDKVALLVSLLRAMGVPAQPTLVSARLGQQVGRVLPSPLAFDHVIARVDLEGQPPLWLDATRSHQSGPLGARQSTGFGRGLELAPGTSELAVLPMPYDVERLRAEDRLRVDSFAGPVQLESRLVLRGDHAEAAREAIAARGVAPVAEGLSAQYFKVYPQLKRVGAAVAEPVEGDDAVAIVQRFEVPDFWRFAEQRVLIGDIAQWAPAEFLLPPKSETRTQPLGISHPGFYRHHVRVEFAEDVYSQLSPPRRQDEGDDRHFRLTTRFESTRRQVDYDAELRVGADRVEPSEWKAFLAATSRALPRLQATVGAPPVPPDRVEAVQRELKALDEGLRSRRIPAVTRTQIESRVKQIMLTAAIDGGRLAPPLKAQTLVARGVARDHLGLLDDARADFDAALAIDPASADALEGAAVNAQSRGDVDRALALTAQVLLLRPSDAGALFTRGVTEYMAGRTDAAKGDFEAALADTAALRRGYPLLWLALTAQRAGADLAPLALRYPRTDWPSEWPRPLLDAVFDSGDAGALLRRARAEKTPMEAQTEAHFVLGERAAARGDAAEARAQWQKAVDLGVVEFVEHNAARQRLAAMASR